MSQHLQYRRRPVVMNMFSINILCEGNVMFLFIIFHHDKFDLKSFFAARLKQHKPCFVNFAIFFRENIETPEIVWLLTI